MIHFELYLEVGWRVATLRARMHVHARLCADSGYAKLNLEKNKTSLNLNWEKSSQSKKFRLS